MLCVTHLAQVAAFADTQVVVEKAVEPVERVRGTGNGGVTERDRSRAQVLDGDDRVAELSRMLAGAGTSAQPASPPPSCSPRPPRPAPTPMRRPG